MKSAHRAGALLAALAITFLPGCSREASPTSQATGAITITDAWARETSAAVPVSAGYARIANGTGRAVELVAAQTPPAGKVEIHTIIQENGVAKMRELTDGLPIPAGETVELRPGGYHLMLLQLSRPVRAGERLPVTLRFDDGTTQTVDFEARTAAGSMGGHHE